MRDPRQTLRYRLRDLSARVGMSAREFRTQVALAATIMVLIATLTGIGSYLDRYFFYYPVMKMRALVGADPKLPDDILLVLVDDLSLKRIDRHPEFADWRRITGVLAKAGVERSFLFGYFDLESELGDYQAAEGGGFLAMGAVAHPQKNNYLGLEETEIDKFLLPPGKGPPYLRAERVLTSHPKILPLIDTIGHFNVKYDDTVHLAWSLPSGALIPHLALRAVPGLRFDTGTDSARNALGEIPSSPDGSIYIDLIAPEEIYKAAIPARFFFKDKEVITAMPDSLANRVAKAKVALLIPNAFTGGRFVSSHWGMIPAWHYNISLFRNVLVSRYIYEPLPRLLSHILIVGVGLLLLAIRHGRLALYLGASWIVVQYVCSAMALEIIGWHLTTGQATATLLTALVVRAAQHSLAAMADRIKLQNDLSVGEAVQRLLLPESRAGRTGPWEYAIRFQSFGPMSGDWFQIHAPEDDVAAGVIAFGDVVGKGPSAALNTAVIASAWQQAIRHWGADLPIEAFLTDLDAIMLKTFRSDQFSTLSLASFRQNHLRLICCGGMNWISIRPGNSERIRSSKHNPIGLGLWDAPPKVLEVTPEPGQFFLAFTDGVIDGYTDARKLMREIDRAPLPTDFDLCFDYLFRLAIQIGAKSALPDDQTFVLLRFDTAEESRLAG